MPSNDSHQAHDYAERIRERLPRRLQELREAARLSKYALRQKDGVSRDMIGRIEAGGHSLGAFTGGVTVDLGGAKARSFCDPRVRCVLPISAQGTGQQGPTASSWSALTIPMLTITGSRDRGAGGQGPEWKEEPFRFSPAGDKYLVFLEGANHVGFGGARGGAITDAVKAGTLAFWQAYLRDDAAAKASLVNGSVLVPWKETARIEAK